jgi:SAM-dependent methyltransferase
MPSLCAAPPFASGDPAGQHPGISAETRRIEAAPVGGRTLEIFDGTPQVNAWVYSKFSDHVRGDVLEVGSGIGNLSRLILKDADSAVLTDVEAPYLAHLRETFGSDQRVLVTRFNLDEAAPAEIAQRRFDAIVAVNVIEHIQDDHRAVDTLASLLKPGGRLLIYVPAVPLAYGTLDQMLGHYRRYTSGSLVDLLRSVGLEPGSVRYFNLLGLLGWFVNGRILRRSTLSASQVAVFERLVTLLRIEDRVRLPIGLGVISCALKPM